MLIRSYTVNDPLFSMEHATELEEWKHLVVYQPEQVCNFIREFSAKCLSQYVATKRAIPLYVIGRQTSKAYNALKLKMPYGHFVRIGCITNSLALDIGMRATTNAITLLPKIVAETMVARIERGQTMPYGPHVLDGTIDGPDLSPKGIQLAVNALAAAYDASARVRKRFNLLDPIVMHRNLGITGMTREQYQAYADAVGNTLEPMPVEPTIPSSDNFPHY